MGINKVSLEPPVAEILYREAWLLPAVAAVLKTEAILKFNFATRLHACVYYKIMFLK